jgi:hypothetical protein
MIIRFFSDFADSAKLKVLIETINEWKNDNSNKITVTAGEDYTHVVIFNRVMPNISHIPKQNVLGFAQEPLPFLNITDSFIEYAKKHIGTYFIGDKLNLPDPFVELNGFLCYNLPNNDRVLCNKPKRMSIMVSQKRFAPGHEYRHQLVREILLRNLPIDIYGRGCPTYMNTNDSRLKGVFENNLEMLYDYEFAICVENFVSNHYFSEKVIDPLLCNTTPIYLGCKNIESYFPEQTIRLCGELQKDIRLITDILSSPEKYRKTIDIPLVKSTVFLLKNINNLFS